MSSTSTRDLLELVLEASPNGIVVCEEAGAIVFVNRQIEALFGWTRGDLVHAGIDMILPGALRGIDLGEPLRSTTGTRSVWEGREVLGRRRDGSEIPVDLGLTAARAGDGLLLIASVVDASERRRNQQQAEADLIRRLAFERVATQVAARFVDLADDQIDEAIEWGLQKIVEALDLDRSAIWQFNGQRSDLRYTHAWWRAECEPPPLHVAAMRDFPWFASKILANEPVWISSTDEVPDSIDRESLQRIGNRSTAVVPLVRAGRVAGAISFGTMRREHPWSEEERERLLLLASLFAHAFSRKLDEGDLKQALADVQRLSDRLTLENVHLREEVKTLRDTRPIAAESPAVREVLAQADSVARTSSTVLLLGETGTGKELFAEAIHAASDRHARPMVRVNCAAIPTALLESELFGRERGAYTGALSRQVGRFELAEGSTIFLDEIAEVPLEAQSKLLRVIQERVVERLGGNRAIKVDVRIIAATNRDLGRAVKEGSFREDLFYRLNVFPLTVPPLRERPEDIPVLVWTFIEEFSRTFNKKIESIGRDQLAELQRHTWPGNVRELRNVIERAVIVSRGPKLIVDVPRPDGGESRESRENPSLWNVERDHIRRILERVGWRVRGPGGAASLLGMKPTTLDSRMLKLGLRRPGR